MEIHQFFQTYLLFWWPFCLQTLFFFPSLSLSLPPSPPFKTHMYVRSWPLPIYPLGPNCDEIRIIMGHSQYHTKNSNAFSVQKKEIRSKYSYLVSIICASSIVPGTLTFVGLYTAINWMWAPPPPTKCLCWNLNSQCDGIGRWAFWEVIRL